MYLPERPNDREWTGCKIKSVPYVEQTYTDRRGKEKKRSLEQMLRTLKKRLSKSGIPEEMKKRRHYEKPSTTKRRARKNRRYEEDKRVARARTEARSRGDRPRGTR